MLKKNLPFTAIKYKESIKGHNLNKMYWRIKMFSKSQYVCFDPSQFFRTNRQTHKCVISMDCYRSSVTVTRIFKMIYCQWVMKYMLQRTIWKVIVLVPYPRIILLCPFQNVIVVTRFEIFCLLSCWQSLLAKSKNRLSESFYGLKRKLQWKWTYSKGEYFKESNAVL